jgi:hypothetical protein
MMAMLKMEMKDGKGDGGVLFDAEDSQRKIAVAMAMPITRCRSGEMSIRTSSSPWNGRGDQVGRGASGPERYHLVEPILDRAEVVVGEVVVHGRANTACSAVGDRRVVLHVGANAGGVSGRGSGPPWARPRPCCRAGRACT